MHKKNYWNISETKSNSFIIQFTRYVTPTLSEFQKSLKQARKYINIQFLQRYALNTSMRVTQKKSISCERRLELFVNNRKLLLWDQLIVAYITFAHMILYE